MKKRIMLLAAMLCAIANGVTAQQPVPSMTGTDFWASFLPNFSYQTLAFSTEHSFLIASTEDCTVHIESTASSWSTTVNITANQMEKIVVPEAFPPETGYACCVLNNSWHITTSAPASVYASSFEPASHDITAVLPTSALRKKYMTQTYNRVQANNEVVVVAPYDNTELRVVLAEDMLNFNNIPIRHAGDIINVTLMQGDIYFMQAHGGFSGSRITASKPIAVFEGHNCAYVPEYCPACDHLYEQSLPTEYWGRNFVVMPTTGRSVYIAEAIDSLGNTHYDTAGNFMGDLVKLTALHDDCIVNIGGQPVDTLASGESYEFLIANHPQEIYISDYENYPSAFSDVQLDFYQSDALAVNTSSPAMVCFYISGITFGGTPGDPASVIVPPIEQGVHHAVTAAYNSERTQNHYINILTPNTDTSLITLDGQSIASAFTATTEGYSWARMTIYPGTHVIDADTGQFIATFYGLGFAESYAYIASSALRKINFDLQADRHFVCPGDTVTVTVDLDSDSLSIDWELNGEPLSSHADTIRLVLDSVGQYIVNGRISPVGITVPETITVNPTYTTYEHASICDGGTLSWHGQTITQQGDFHDDTLQTNANCDSIISLQLSILEPPTPTFAIETDCSNQHYFVLGNIEGDTTGYAFSWKASPPDTTLAGQPWDSLGLSPTQVTLYKFHIDGPCPFDTTFILQPIQWPIAHMEVEPEQLSFNNPTFKAYDQSLNADSRYWWVDGVPAGSDPILIYTANPSDDSVQLTLVALNKSCADTLHRTLPFNHSVVWTPNVFTPDAESNNRFAVVINNGAAEELYVYNRNGLLVAHIVGPMPKWDGTHNGTPCPQGAYVWHLRYRHNDRPDELRTLTGTITLLR